MNLVRKMLLICHKIEGALGNGQMNIKISKNSPQCKSSMILLKEDLMSGINII